MSINFSVVVPCYNCEKTIIQCIQSIFSQSFLPKEVIVIDDGSSDETLSLLFDLKKQAPVSIEFIVLKQINSGPSVARNKGINHSSYEWIALLDSDDYWMVNNLEIAKNFILDHDKFNLIGGDEIHLNYEEISFNKLLYKSYFVTSSTIVNKAWILKYPFNEKQRYSEDYRSWLLITSETNSCVINNYISKPVISRDFAFSGGGLSSKLWEMEKGELSNYYYLYKLNKISIFKLLLISTYSFFKFIRRCLIK